jgi:hypothetical protein
MTPATSHVVLKYTSITYPFQYHLPIYRNREICSISTERGRERVYKFIYDSVVNHYDFGRSGSLHAVQNKSNYLKIHEVQD